METFENSSKSFEKAKTDMNRMNSQLIKMQGDVFRSKKQLEEANAKIMVLAAEKQELEKDNAVKSQQIEKLKALCRELQKGAALTDTKPDEPEATETKTEQ